MSYKGPANGVRTHKASLSDGNNHIPVEYYQKALRELNNKQRKLLAKKERYFCALKEFSVEYEALRKLWKKEVICLKRSLALEKLKDFDIELRSD